ncbi:MAG: DegV family protein [Acutalibacteraceae bacterium]|nr:DegV family protein [Acutalibacteraceae bacterium]
MSKFILSGCSTMDLTEERLKERDIKYICYHFTMDGEVYPDDLGKTISNEEFYQKLVDGADATTSQVNYDEFVEYFTPFLEQGYDILHVCMSSGITGVFNSANIAKNDLLEKYPDRKIILVDSLAASSGYGLLMETLADLRDKGMPMEEIAYFAESNKLHLHHWFFSTDLTFFVKGGRISKAAGWFGTMLNLCPLLNVSNEGKLIPRYKVRGKQAVIKKIVEKMEEHAENGHDYDGRCYICHAACIKDATAVRDLIEERFPKLKGKVEIYNIGTTIGCHTGPGTVALFFYGDERID